MDITFKDKKIEKLCNNQKQMQRRCGTVRAKILSKRLISLRAAQNLAQMSKDKQPENCHELKGDHAGQLSIDLDQPYRLIFTPANDPIPYKEDGGLDWVRVTAICICDIEDTHE